MVQQRAVAEEKEWTELEVVAKGRLKQLAKDKRALWNGEEGCRPRCAAATRKIRGAHEQLMLLDMMRKRPRRTRRTSRGGKDKDCGTNSQQNTIGTRTSTSTITIHTRNMGRQLGRAGKGGSRLARRAGGHCDKEEGINGADPARTGREKHGCRG